MRWSINIGRINGIALRLHVTFVLLLLVIAYQGYAVAGGRGAFWSLLLICAVFACVVLHELGHSLVAQQLGVEVRSITLLPIGGVAALRTIPEQPWREIAITVAGPLVNLIIAGALLPVAGLPRHLLVVHWPANVPALLNTLVGVNLWMFLFNCIPAFPMDGGRLFRALLALLLPYRRATWLATTLGQALAIGFFLFGLKNSSILLIVLGAFIFLAAEGEERLVQTRGLLRELEVGDVMARAFVTLAPTDPVSRGLEQLYQTAQDDFPVVTAGGELVGMVSRQALLDAVNTGDSAAPVAGCLGAPVPVVAPHDRVISMYDQMAGDAPCSLPVVERGRLVGLLTPDNINRYLGVHSHIKPGRRVPPRGAGQTPEHPPGSSTVPPTAIPPPLAESRQSPDRG